MKTTIVPHDTSHAIVTSSRPCAVFNGADFDMHEPGEVYVSMVMLEATFQRDYAKVIEHLALVELGDRVDELVIYERMKTRNDGEGWWARYGAVAYLKTDAERAS